MIRSEFSAGALCIIAAVGATPVLAADLGGAPAPPSADYSAPLEIERWTGFYVGATYGYAWNDTDVNGDFGDFTLDSEGGIGTLLAGYNMQFGRFVLGAEADVGWGDLQARENGLDGELDTMGSLRARAGFLFAPALLVYGTGGLAIADFDFSDRSGGATETFTGYQVGGGAELALSPGWSLRVEYIHTDFDTETIRYTDGLEETFDPDLDTVRAGVSFKF